MEFNIADDVIWVVPLERVAVFSVVHEILAFLNLMPEEKVP